jgi:hypothetical protein
VPFFLYCRSKLTCEFIVNATDSKRDQISPVISVRASVFLHSVLAVWLLSQRIRNAGVVRQVRVYDVKLCAGMGNVNGVVITSEVRQR